MLDSSPSHLISVDSLCLFPVELWCQVLLCKGNNLITSQCTFHQNRITVTWYWKSKHSWINDLCNTEARAEHKLTLQSIQKSFSKFYFSNTECPIIPDTNTVLHVFVWIRVYTVVKYEVLTFTVLYLAHTVYKDRRVSLSVNQPYKHDWVHIEKPTPLQLWCDMQVWRSLP